MTKGLVVCALAASLLQTPTFKARIDLVQVDVVVVDASGKPVHGLTASDFTVLDRGKPQTVASFDEVSHARPHTNVPEPAAAIPGVAMDVSNNQSAQAGRLIVMVIDDLHIYKERTDRARAIARKVLADLAPQSSMAVLFTSGEHSVPVTQDPARLTAAVETLTGRQSWRRPHIANDEQRAGIVGPDASIEAKLAAIQKAQDAKLQDFFDNMTQYKTLQDAARMLGGGDVRRKAFVLVSEGIAKELTGLFGAMAPSGDIPEGGVAYAFGDSAATTAVPAQTYHDFALIDMMESLRRSNVATYAIDPRGRVESKDLLRECFPAPNPGLDPCSSGFSWKSDIRLAQNGLSIMAEASGGFAITNTDDFTSGIGRIVDDLDHYYLLGFYPSDTKGKGYRPLNVRIPAHPDWRVRYRHGYMPGGAPAPKNTSELVALSSGVLPRSDLPLRLAVVPLAAASRVAYVLEVTVPRQVMQESDGRLRDTLKYEVLVVDEKKAKVRSVSGLEGKVTLSANEAAGSVPDVATYQIGDAIELRPGRYEIRVSATSVKLGKGGSVYLPVEVPDFRAAPVELGGIAIGYADGPRVPAAPRSIPPVQRAARVVTPVAQRPPDLPLTPSLDRAFTAADTLRVYAEGAVREGLRPVVEVTLVDASGRSVRAPSASFAVRDIVRVMVDVPLQGVAPGAYVLRVRLSADGHAAVREIGLAVR